MGRKRAGLEEIFQNPLQPAVTGLGCPEGRVCVNLSLYCLCHLALCIVGAEELG